MQRDHQLLLVPLDDGGRAHLGLIRILAELAPRVPLPQEIPTLIELDLDGFQPYLIVIGQFALPVKMLLLVNKTFDLLQDGMIGRRFSHINHLADLPLSIFTPSVLQRAEELIARGRGSASGSHAESA
jgi:hypothetical protein